MDAVTVYGLIAVSLMLLFYALEERGPVYTLGFAFACVMAAVYGFLAGAWPFGVLEIVWAGIAANKWRQRTEGRRAAR